MANALLVYHPTDEVKTRSAELAVKANFGTITDDEHVEYRECIELDMIFAIKKSRAKHFLATRYS